MEISGSGLINSMISADSKKLTAGAGETNGFAGLIASLMKGQNDIAENVSISEENGELRGDEIAELLQFLQLNDLAQLENGMELMERAVFHSETDILTLIEGEMNLSSKELFQLLSSFLEKASSDFNSEALNNGAGDNQELNLENQIMALIEVIASLKLDGLKLSPDKDFGQALKALKLFDLLSAHQDSFGSQVKLKEFLKNMNDKLEILLNGSAVNKREILQKTFTSVAEELNRVRAENSMDNSSLIQDSSTKITLKSDTVHQGFFQIQQISKPEQLTMMNATGKPVTADQLIEQFESILSKSHLLKNGGTQKLFIKLNPDHLGALRVELIQKDSVLIARILTSTSAAKDILDSQLNGLKQAFNSQNIQVERLEISQQMTQQERSFNRDPQHGQEQQKEQSEQKQQQQNAFNQSFEEALLNAEV